jgi:hypothetical protein
MFQFKRAMDATNTRKCAEGMSLAGKKMTVRIRRVD